MSPFDRLYVEVEMAGFRITANGRITGVGQRARLLAAKATNVCFPLVTLPSKVMWSVLGRRGQRYSLEFSLVTEMFGRVFGASG